MIIRSIIILFVMIFLHIVDDFYLQGVLANMKQKKWWESQIKLIAKERLGSKPRSYFKHLYQYDWAASLAIHGFSWSFMVNIPSLAVLLSNKSVANDVVVTYVVMVLGNAALHAYIDDAKCNAFKLSLLEDQILHLCQIIVMWVIFVVEVCYGRIQL